MSDEKIKQSVANLGKALSRLEEALQVNDPNLLIKDGTIQRFEFVIELYWKTLKHLLNKEGIHCLTPKETLKAAYQAEWLNDETIWLEMLNDRNQTSHTYDEELANKIYSHIKNNFSELEAVYQKICRL